MTLYSFKKLVTFFLFYGILYDTLCNVMHFQLHLMPSAPSMNQGKYVKMAQAVFQLMDYQPVSKLL